MRWPLITRAAHERILRACEDAALERLEAELAQANRAHVDALDRYRGRMRPAAREAADQREAARGGPFGLGGPMDEVMDMMRRGDTFEAAAKRFRAAHGLPW